MAKISLSQQVLARVKNPNRSRAAGYKTHFSGIKPTPAQQTQDRATAQSTLLSESETRELKKSTSELKEAVISIASILNKHQKGELYFGVKPNGEVIGQGVTEKTIRDISKTISDHIEPKIFPKINEVVLDGKKCVHIEFIGNNVPYYAYGRAYIRVADEDRQLSAQEIERIILDKNKDTMAWDKEICKEAKLSDINTEKLKLFLKKTGKTFDTVENSLKKLNLLSQ